jgi:two-component system response regulator FixJ
MTASPIVFVVDDDPAMRDSLKFLIGSVGITVKPFASAEDFLKEFQPHQHACIVLDVRMPGLSGLELLERLKEERLTPPVLLITGHGDVPMAVRALKAGAFDFIEKPFSDQVLLERIQQALSLDDERRTELESVLVIEERLNSLTPREREVFEIVVSGTPNKVIASRLELSQKTVEVHRAHVMEKMRAPSLADLVKMAVVLGSTGAPASL